MDPVTTSLVSRQDLAFNGLKQAAQQDQQAVQLVEQAAAESKAEPAGDEKPLRPTTLETHLKAIASALAYAVEEGILAEVPDLQATRYLKLLEKRHAARAKQVDAWSDAEVETIAELARRLGARAYQTVRVLLATGMRRGELFGLRWEDVDFQRRTLQIRQTIVNGEKSAPKSGKARKIAIPYSLCEFLLEMRHEQESSDLPLGYVMRTDSGAPMTPSAYYYDWRRLRKLAEAQGVRHLKPHTTRHTYASRALRSGKSIPWLQKQLGHSDMMITVNTYGHLLDEDETDLSFAELGQVQDQPKLVAVG